MTQRNNGRKESNFPASNTLPSGAYLTYFASGVNYKIDLDSFLSSLNVTGTIEQKGSSTGTPVLEKQGAVNGIRNIENGPGVKASISPQNGIKLSHNFVNGGGDVDLIADIGLTQPKIRGLTAGDGVSLAELDDEIVISLTAESVSTKTVIVSTLADLPAASGGVITLDSDKDYFFVKDISTANRFVTSGATVIRASSSQMVQITYTGTDPFISSSNPNLKIYGITLDCPSAPVFNISSTANGIFQIVESNIQSCDTIGTIGSMFIVRFDRVAFENIISGGLTFSGTVQNILFNTNIIFLNGGTFINFGAAVSNTINIVNMIVQQSAAATTFLSGAASSANIATGGLGVVTNCRIAGSATFLNGITTGDNLWNFSLNDDIDDTRADGLLSMQSNATNTVITVTSTPVLVAGTWTVQEVSQFTATAAGRLTYTGGKNAKLPITASLSVAPVSGTNKLISVYVAINGSIVADSDREVVVSSGSPRSVTSPWQYEFTPGDYIEMFIGNESDTTDILVSSAVLRVN